MKGIMQILEGVTVAHNVSSICPKPQVTHGLTHLQMSNLVKPALD